MLARPRWLPFERAQAKLDTAGDLDRNELMHLMETIRDTRHPGGTDIENDARMDIFAAAMLGHLEIVRAMLTAVPDARRWRGPHGIPLLKHAEAGGAEAAPVADYLHTLGCV